MHNCNLNKRSVTLILALLPFFSFAQSMRNIKPLVNNKPRIIVDYGDAIDVNTRVPFRGDLRSAASSRVSASNAAVFEVTYTDFTQEQQTAFQYAVDIWSSLIQSDVPIRIDAKMSPLDEGVLGQAGATARYANFDNAQKINTFYVVAMAEKIAGKELNNPGDADIFMEFSSTFNWYYGLDGNTPSTQYDFVSVILHEIGHGLGFSDGTFNSNGTGYYTVYGAPMVYDRHIELGDGSNLVETFTTGTTELGDALVSGNLFFNSFAFPTANDRPKLYAPSSWSSGSSIAHLDEATYPAGDPNSLMSPSFSYGESIHDPGIALQMFEDMGWVAMQINHQKLLDSEDSVSDRVITVIAKGDSAVLTGGVNLHYTYSDFTNEVIVNMTPTGTANEYTGTIPATGNGEKVSYYINVDAQGGKTYTSPGEAPQYFWQFVMARDTIAPTIKHDSLSLVFLHDAVVPITATVTDNMGVTGLTLSYRINGGATSTVAIPLTSSTIDGQYKGEYSLNWDIGALGVVQGDIVEYSLSTQDIAAVPNTTTLPAPGFYTILVEEIGPAVTFYENDFNVASSDFVGLGFRIGPETGFDSDAIQSDHPYRIVDGVAHDDTLELTYMLKTPIILSSLDASLSFDEVVLVEPGESGTAYGSDQFWDYVIVEGSTDLGASWVPLADGYDSRQNQLWLDQWNSDKDTDGNSIAVGDKTLFINKKINMTANGNFNAGDTVLIRFKVYADPLVHGWGWAIDNLKIQVDEKPPVITQVTPDYMFVGDTEIVLNAKVTDNTVLDSVIYEVDLNGTIQYLSLPGSAGQYTVNLTFSPAISATDVFKYRIIAVDKAKYPNTTIAPATGYFEVPVAEIGSAKTMYINDFDTPTDDFVGVNFSITQPDRFDTPALVSANPYPDGPFGTTEISYLLKYPITLNQAMAMVSYDEVVLVEPGVDKVAFDVSKDGGATWIPALDPYDASEQVLWQNTFNNFDQNGNSTGFAQPVLIRNRQFNILDNPEINGGDEVLIRFRISVNDAVHGWGWIIDNLEIQGPTTGIEDTFPGRIEIYPNPAKGGRITLAGNVQGNKSQVVVTDLLGKIVHRQEVAIKNNTLNKTLDLSQLKTGIYLISLTTDKGIYTSRVVVE